MKDNFIIDFDSTFIKVEALDLLAGIVLKDNPKKQEIISEITKITAMGMEGDISFSQSLSKRLQLLTISRLHLEKLVKLLKSSITPSFKINKKFFRENKTTIYIVSGGFKEYIYPVVKQFGILENHILANNLIIKKDKVIGFNKSNLLSQNQGKAKVVKSLNLSGKVHVLGDGYTDYEIKKFNKNINFVVFCENVERKSIMAKADLVVKSFDEFLFSQHLKSALSYPKSKMKALMLENIHPVAIDWFKNQGYNVEILKDALSEKDLCQKIKDVSILGIRSKTEVTKKVLENAEKLIAIGAFCIGTNQIDLQFAAQKGVVVFNAPFSNTRSVVELTLAEIIMLSRNVADKNKKLHNGIWDKSSSGSHEIRGKTLGIIGYGNIGTQLGILAENLGMDVYFYDTAEKLALGNAKRCTALSDLLKISDVVTVHVDGRKSNKNLIGEKEFRQMKDNVIFLNLSRGFIVDISSLADFIKNGKVKGAGVDVFPEEPSSNAREFKSKLRNLPNVFLTPHVGGSTEEAQKNIGEFTSKKITDYIDVGNTTLSVNFPILNLTSFKKSYRLIHIHSNVPGVLGKFNSILAKYKINIEGQYLGTNNEIGYVITDINKKYDKKLLDELKSIPETIKFRILY